MKLRNVNRRYIENRLENAELVDQMRSICISNEKDKIMQRQIIWKVDRLIINEAIVVES